MKQLLPDLSDNLYYLDSLGSIDDQVEWLKSQHVLEAALSVDHELNEILHLTCIPSVDDAEWDRINSVIKSKYFRILPSKSHNVFGGKFTVPVREYFADLGFSVSSIIYYSPLNSKSNEIS